MEVRRQLHDPASLPLFSCKVIPLRNRTFPEAVISIGASHWFRLIAKAPTTHRVFLGDGKIP